LCHDLEVYIRRRMSSLAGNRLWWGLDKSFAQVGCERVIPCGTREPSFSVPVGRTFLSGVFDFGTWVMGALARQLEGDRRSTRAKNAKDGEPRPPSRTIFVQLSTIKWTLLQKS
jgi:hypothetical protein